MSERNRRYQESGMKRVVGIPPEAEESALAVFDKWFSQENRSPVEIKKSESAIETINQLNDELETFMAQYDVTWRRIPEKNIHFFDVTKWPEQVRKQLPEILPDGHYLPAKQQVHVFKKFEDSPLNCSQVMVHEMLHANSFQSIEKKESVASKDVTLKATGDDGERWDVNFGMRRMGFGVMKRDGTESFRAIDEAIIQELAVRFDQERSEKIPALKKEVEMRKSVLARSPDIQYDVSHISLEKQRSLPGYSIQVHSHSYEKERGHLSGLIDDLAKKNEMQRDDVFRLFVEATMDGSLLPVARIIEKTYGKGSFRSLGEHISRGSK